MAMPNRSKEVKAICKEYPQAFVENDPTLKLDNRRRLLIPIVCKRLNAIDGDRWGLLYKNDRQDDDPRPGRLTSDVLVWRPTGEHVDVLSGSGGMWKEHPPITDKDWVVESPDIHIDWDDLADDDEPEPTPEPNPEPVPPPSADISREYATRLLLDAFERNHNDLLALQQEVAGLRQDFVAGSDKVTAAIRNIKLF